MFLYITFHHQNFTYSQDCELYKERIMKSIDNDEELEILELYKNKKKKTLDAGVELEKLLKEVEKMTKPSSYSNYKTKKKNKKPHYTGRLSNKYNQRCIAKMSYGTTKKAHEEHIDSYMTQDEKEEVIEKPTYFDAVYDEVPDSEIEKYKSEMTDMYYKFMLSPESKKVPLMTLAREFMKNLQLQTGYSFLWKGVIHLNTDDAHVHICINGKDRRTGKLIERISPRIIRNAHLITEQICTSLVGHVTDKELEIRKKKHTLPSDGLSLTR